MNFIKSYINQTLGLSFELQAMEPKKLVSLPFYLKSGIDFYTAKLNGTPMVFAKMDAAFKQTPAQLQKTEEQLYQHFMLPVVFVLSVLEPYERKRLIERKLPFVLENKQLYLPFMFIDLHERKKRQNTNKKRYLSTSAQRLLLYHLQIQNLNNYTFREISDVLNVSTMYISRAMNELKSHEIYIRESESLSTISNNKTVWKQALPYLTTPVKKTTYVNQLPEVFIKRLAGLTALTHYTNIADNESITYALSTGEYKLLKSQIGVEEYPNNGPVKVEIWKYTPLELPVVDRLSLYLSLKDTEDERIELALDELIATWLKE